MLNLSVINCGALRQHLLKKNEAIMTSKAFEMPFMASPFSAL